MGPPAVRSKYLGTPAIWTRPVGVRAHNQSFLLGSLKSRTDKLGLIGIRAAVSYLRRTYAAIRFLMYPGGR